MKFPNPQSLMLNAFVQERERLPLWIPVMLGAGMALYFSLLFEPPSWPALTLLALFVLAGCLLRRHLLARVLCIALALLAGGFALAQFRTQLVSTPVLYGELFYKTVEARVDDIHLREKARRLVLTDAAIEGLPTQRTPQRLSITLKKDAPDVRIGDRVRVKAMLFAPPAPAMPGGYDYTRALYFQGIGAVGFSPSEIEILEKGAPRQFEEALNTLRLVLAERISAPLSKENAPVATSIMVGEQSAVSEEVSEAMRDAGIYHVLSISGLHMTLAAGLLYFTARLLLALYPPLALRWPVKKIAACIGLTGAFAYLLLAGYPVPAVRSFIMVACVMLAILCDRRGISLYSLAWAATLILLWQPEAVVSASFQLSFAATLGIVALYERFSHSFAAWGEGLVRRVWLYFVAAMMTSLVATLMTAPLVIHHFNRFTALGIIANMLLMPLISFWIMPVAVVALIAMPFGLELWPLKLLDSGLSLMVEGARWFAGFSASNILLPSLSSWGFALTIIGGLWLCLWKTNLRFFSLPIIFIGIATIALQQPYDLLISDDGSKAALRQEDGRWLFLRGTPESFDGAQWLRAHAEADAQLAKDSPQASCDRTRCIISAYGRKIVIGKSKKRRDALCDGSADILISDAYLSMEECDHIEHVFDKRKLNQTGAVGIRFSGEKMEVVTASELRGARPWVMLPPQRLHRQENHATTADDEHTETTEIKNFP
ncbi:MAG: ComEC/Rec2 family competence protein [Alphaproteobacteria bacterium]|nr:ComEC/Rec2 family competence protein [Alphaproteobacteria bacterium]